MQTARRSRPECSLWADRQGQCTGLLVLSWWWWSPETITVNYVEDLVGGLRTGVYCLTL